MKRKRLIDEQPGVPFRIREIRYYATLALTDDVFAEDIMTHIWEMKRWLADPAVPDDLRVGDRDVLEKLLAQLAERWNAPPGEDPCVRQAMNEARGQTLH